MNKNNFQLKISETRKKIYKRIYNQSKRREIEKKLSRSKYIQHFYNEN